MPAPGLLELAPQPVGQPAEGPAPNSEVARHLDEVALLLEQQDASPFRVRAYRTAAATVRTLPVSVAALYHDVGLDGLEQIPGVGRAIARAIRDLLIRGRLPLLDHLRGEADPEALLATIPGIGPAFAERLHQQLGIETLEALELAAHDGRLAVLDGFGPKRLAMVTAALAQRLGRVRHEPDSGATPPPVAELLEVDREYRDQADAGRLPTIAPRRFNPGHRSWLPVLHQVRGPRHYTALYSNTARAHHLNRTHDWVVIYSDGDREEHQATVVTARTGPLAGHRIVRGREPECAAFYRGHLRPRHPRLEGAEP
jgi:predicted flap endonuclease-1-like 5' DNA nuclease